MIIETFPSGIFETNAYVVASEVDKTTCIIDPGQNSAQKINLFIDSNHLKVVAILLTHSHWDHIVDVAALKEKYGCPIYLHEEDRPNLVKPGSDGLPLYFPIQGIEPDVIIKDGDLIEVGGLKFKVIHTPGHSGGSVCFYDEENQILFSGDTLFQGTIGNLSFPTSNADRMWKSLEKLTQLPGQVRVLPGHGAETTIGKETWLKDAKKYFGG